MRQSTTSALHRVQDRPRADEIPVNRAVTRRVYTVSCRPPNRRSLPTAGGCTSWVHSCHMSAVPMKSSMRASHA